MNPNVSSTATKSWARSKQSPRRQSVTSSPEALAVAIPGVIAALHVDISEGDRETFDAVEAEVKTLKKRLSNDRDGDVTTLFSLLNTVCRAERAYD